MVLIASEDYTTNRIYLSVDSIGIDIQPIDIYKEHRLRRRLNVNNERKFPPMVSAFGNQQIGAAKFTPRFTDLNSGVKIVPYDATHTLKIRGSLISAEDQSEGADLFDRSSLLSIVDIDYQPPQVEIIMVSTGSGLDSTQSTQLTTLFNATTSGNGATAFSTTALANAPTGGSGSGNAPTEAEIYTYFTEGTRANAFKATGFSTLNAQQVWEYATRSLTDKVGFALTTEERNAIAVAVEVAIIDEGDPSKVIDAFLQVINAQFDLPAAEQQAIAQAVRAELAIELARIDANITSRSTFDAATTPVTVNAADIYGYFTADNRQNIFKSDVSSLALQTTVLPITKLAKRFALVDGVSTTYTNTSITSSDSDVDIMLTDNGSGSYTATPN
ncbi:MAG: hypothetical protein KME47_09665 [Nodosilinea sp. WJT8-NPBG4]|jgi:hypothetical protein|nr:hypothetical protein [Nodosilinea sp. WJT8-NPBG4]